WVPGDVLAEVILKRLGVKPGVGAAAPTVVLLSCQAMDDVARGFAEVYPGDVYASRYPVWIRKAGADLGRIITGRGVPFDADGRLLAPVLDGDGNATGVFEKVNHRGPGPAPELPMPASASAPVPAAAGPDAHPTWSPLGGPTDPADRGPDPSPWS